MSIPITIPVGANPIFTQNSFTTTFNAFTPGRYDFTSDPNSLNNTVYVLDPNSIYIIEGVLFSMGSLEGDFQASIDPAAGFPKMKLTTLRSQQQLFTNSFPLQNYLNDFEIVLFFHSTQKNDELLMSFEGLFSQSGGLIGQLTYTAYVQLIMYEITAAEWTGKYFDIKTDLGSDLNFRGR